MRQRRHRRSNGQAQARAKKPQPKPQVIDTSPAPCAACAAKDRELVRLKDELRQRAAAAGLEVTALRRQLAAAQAKSAKPKQSASTHRRLAFEGVTIGVSGLGKPFATRSGFCGVVWMVLSVRFLNLRALSLGCVAFRLQARGHAGSDHPSAATSPRAISARV